MPQDENGEEYDTGSEESSEDEDEIFSDTRCIKCKTLLQAGLLDRCEECFDEKYIGFPCLTCERKGLDTPALLGTYYCKVCREEECESERGKH